MRHAHNPTADAALDSDIAARTHTSRRKQYRWITQIIFPYFFCFVIMLILLNLSLVTLPPVQIPYLRCFPARLILELKLDVTPIHTLREPKRISARIHSDYDLLCYSLSLSLSGPPSFSHVHLAANGNSIQKLHLDKDK